MNRAALFCLLFALWMAAGSSLRAQGPWVKYEQNPVLLPSAQAYEQFIGGPSVIREEGGFKMYYASTGTDGKGRILMATSSDGVHWNKRAEPVLDVNPLAGAWDGFFLDCPEVLKDDTGYKMYYFAQPGEDPLQSAIGLATSTDGVHWERHPANPVLTPGDHPADMDYNYIESPTVAYLDGRYYMLYTAVDSFYLIRTGLALSEDGVHWQKDAGNPIFDVYQTPEASNLYQWDGGGAGMPSLIARDGKLEVWYNGISVYNRYYPDENALHIGYAYSLDEGRSWVKYADNPVLSTTSPPFTQWERRGPIASDVLYDETDQTYKMWYETAYGFGLATHSRTASNTDAPADLPIGGYPNPSEWSLFDMSGRLLFREKNQTRIDLSAYRPGVYILRIESEKKSSSIKIIKK
ncbi:MAG: T9SS type A sorting domain-containing protein [Tannerellaceae bacterium]|jgi:hypothetical protein|nr:T9SS type A sorting domain-containing protein [Tannerellaceae bacterium]